VLLTSSGESTNPPGHRDADEKNEIDSGSDSERQMEKKLFSPVSETMMENQNLEEVG